MFVVLPVFLLAFCGMRSYSPNTVFLLPHFIHAISSLFCQFYVTSIPQITAFPFGTLQLVLVTVCYSFYTESWWIFLCRCTVTSRSLFTRHTILALWVTAGPLYCTLSPAEHSRNILLYCTLATLAQGRGEFFCSCCCSCFDPAALPTPKPDYSSLSHQIPPPLPSLIQKKSVSVYPQRKESLTVRFLPLIRHGWQSVHGCENVS